MAAENRPGGAPPACPVREEPASNLRSAQILSWVAPVPISISQWLTPDPQPDARPDGTAPASRPNFSTFQQLTSVWGEGASPASQTRIAFFMPALLILSSLVIPRTTEAQELIEDNILMHRVTISDPHADILDGGNAFDRKRPDLGEQPELGVNHLGANTAVFSIFPPQAVPRVTFRSVPDTIADVTIVQQSGTTGTLRVFGKEEGGANIRVPTFSPANLGVAVFTPIMRTIAVHVISDTANHGPSNLSQNDVATMLASANAIWGSQSNITFIAGIAPIIDSSVVSGDFGPEVGLVTGGQITADEALLLSTRNPNALINVYLVHDLTIDLVPANGLTKRNRVSGVADVIISMKNIPGSQSHAQTLAHELGHALGLEKNKVVADYDDPHREYQLMWKFGGSGRSIIPIQGEIIRAL